MLEPQLSGVVRVTHIICEDVVMRMSCAITTFEVISIDKNTFLISHFNDMN